jgi:hypothetical protein
MSSFVIFLTPPFTVASASTIDANTIRVTLTAAPNAFVVSNFSIPTTTILSAVSDPQDPNSVILSISPGLQPGNYTVTCSGLTAGAPPVAMLAPFQAAFAVLVGPSISLAPELAQPEINPTAISTLRAHIPPSMKGDVWTQLLNTLGDEEQFAWDQAAAVYDQLFLVSAEGEYLDQRASEEGGYVRPGLVGFTDDVFRDLVIQLSTRKLTLNAFLRILEIYYGIDAVRAHVRTTTAETFNIPDGSEQVFYLDGKGPFTVLFHGADFTNPSAAYAIEVAVALNRGFGLVGAKAFALPFVDAQSNLTYLTVYTVSRGLRGSIESVSGPLSFPVGRQTVQTQERAAYVKSLNGIAEVILPATSVVVSRTPDVDAAYVQDAPPLNILSASLLGGIGDFLSELVVTVDGSHNMSIGSWFFLDGLQAPADQGIDFPVNGLFKVKTVLSSDTVICEVVSNITLGEAVVDSFGNFVIDSFGAQVITNG